MRVLLSLMRALSRLFTSSSFPPGERLRQRPWQMCDQAI